MRVKVVSDNGLLMGRFDGVERAVAAINRAKGAGSPYVWRVYDSAERRPRPEVALEVQ